MEEGVVNEGIPPRLEKVPIANQEKVNEEVPSHVCQDSHAPNVLGYISNAEIRDSFRALTQLMTTQGQVVTNHMAFLSNLRVKIQVKPNVSTPASRIQDFMRMSPTFHETKVDEDS